MNPLGLFPRPEYADVASVGLPRALLYYRYAALWQTFFALEHIQQLGELVEHFTLGRCYRGCSTM